MQRQKNKNEEERQPMMTVNELSTYLSLSQRSVYRLVGDLPAIRVGGRWRFRVSDVEAWLLKQRKASEPQLEPVVELGSTIRLYPHLDPANIFLDAAETRAEDLIRGAIGRATLAVTEGSVSEAKQRILSSILEREALCSTALHPDVAFPHPRDPEKCPLADDRIVFVRAKQSVDFAEIHGYRPRLVFILLGRKASLQLLWEARLSHLLHQEGFVARLLSASTPSDVHSVLAPANEAATRTTA